VEGSERKEVKGKEGGREGTKECKEVNGREERRKK
jgi:hypothetical protein